MSDSDDSLVLEDPPPQEDERAEPGIFDSQPLEAAVVVPDVDVTQFQAQSFTREQVQAQLRINPLEPGPRGLYSRWTLTAMRPAVAPRGAIGGRGRPNPEVKAWMKANSKVGTNIVGDRDYWQLNDTRRRPYAQPIVGIDTESLELEYPCALAQYPFRTLGVAARGNRWPDPVDGENLSRRNINILSTAAIDEAISRSVELGNVKEVTITPAGFLRPISTWLGLTEGQITIGRTTPLAYSEMLMYRYQREIVEPNPQLFEVAGELHRVFEEPLSNLGPPEGILYKVAIAERSATGNPLNAARVAKEYEFKVQTGYLMWRHKHRVRDNDGVVKSARFPAGMVLSHLAASFSNPECIVGFKRGMQVELAIAERQLVNNSRSPCNTEYWAQTTVDANGMIRFIRPGEVAFSRCPHRWAPCLAPVLIHLENGEPDVAAYEQTHTKAEAKVTPSKRLPLTQAIEEEPPSTRAKTGET
jgi:hypothetical protein